MSEQQLDAVLAILRQGAGPDLSGPPEDARRQFEAMLAAMPAPAGVEFETGVAGGVPALWSNTAGDSDRNVLLYLHGGAYVIGTANGYRTLASGLAAAAGARGLAIDYRLAPEHPFPAAVDDALAAYRWLLDQGYAPKQIVIAGDSAGGGLAIAMLVAAKRAGLPMPAAALVISPWADLECLGETITTKAAEDPALDKSGLINMAGLYLHGQSARSDLASPIYADLTGLPPLLIQVGSSEILLDDSIRLARRAGIDGVQTRLVIAPRMTHVWHAFAFMLDEGAQAIAEGGKFLSAHFGT